MHIQRDTMEEVVSEKTTGDGEDTFIKLRSGAPHLAFHIISQKYNYL